MRERLSKYWSGFVRFLRNHRRGIFLTGWFLFVFTAGGGYLLLAQYFSLPFINPLGGADNKSAVALADTAIKETVQPISGTFYSESEAEFWQKKRPLAVMIDNHALARPYQFGLQMADLIYEAVAEGGITRFLAVFHGQSVPKIGPVRSSRVYYIEWALQFPAYYAHVGGASTHGSPANIYDYIASHGVLDLDQFRLGSSTFTFGGNVLFNGGMVLSHINYTSTQKLWNAGQSLYQGTNTLPNFSQWKFKAESPYAQRPKAQKIAFSFWSFPVAYKGEWRYDRITNSYLRFQGGTKHLDQATKKQLSAKNVVLAHVAQYSAGDGKGHLLYTTTGQGNAEIYLDGVKILGTWKRSSVSARMKFYNRGKNTEIDFNRGLTWIEIIPK